MKGPTGRSRPSSIELLPGDLDGFVGRILRASIERRMTQTHAVRLLNDKLSAMGIEKRVSISAFNRFVLAHEGGPIPARYRARGATATLSPEMKAAIGEVIEEWMRRHSLLKGAS